MSNSIERMLEINSRIEKGIVAPKETSNKNAEGTYIRSQSELDKLIENYDRQAYGPAIVNENDKKQTYSAEMEMKHLKEISENGGRSAVSLEGRNIPKAIMESIINDPLDLKPFDPKMDELQKKLEGNMPGIKSATNIIERIDKKDKEERSKLNEKLAHNQNNSSSFDLNELKSIIENVIDNKLSDIKNSLNEGIERNNTYVPSMKMLNFKDKFYFVDNDDNVFECVMKYRGKKKKKQN